jgi:hypothetical protein
MILGKRMPKMMMNINQALDMINATAISIMKKAMSNARSVL